MLTPKHLMYEQQVISDIYQKYNASHDVDSFWFNVSDALSVIDQVATIFQKEPTILSLTTSTIKDFIIVGDLHGNIDSLMRIFAKYGSPSKTKYIFLGDYVDRGSFSSEVIMLLFSYKTAYPENIYLLRGNHEFQSMTDHYGFKNECIKKATDSSTFQFYYAVTSVFQYLPLGAILESKIFLVHGGITALVSNRKQLMDLPKVGNEFSVQDGAMAELLWNDPENDPSLNYFVSSPRGLGCLFGKQALLEFLSNMNFELVIRAHQTVDNGYLWNFEENRYILTVFSSLDYCGMMNDCGVLICSKARGEVELTIDVITRIEKINRTRFYPEECFNHQIPQKYPIVEPIRDLTANIPKAILV